MENPQNKWIVILVWGRDLDRRKVLHGALGLRISKLKDGEFEIERRYSRFQKPLIRQCLPELKPEMTDAEWEAFGIEVKKVIDNAKEKK